MHTFENVCDTPAEKLSELRNGGARRVVREADGLGKPPDGRGLDCAATALGFRKWTHGNLQSPNK